MDIRELIRYQGFSWNSFFHSVYSQVHHFFVQMEYWTRIILKKNLVIILQNSQSTEREHCQNFLMSTCIILQPAVSRLYLFLYCTSRNTLYPRRPERSSFLYYIFIINTPYVPLHIFIRGFILFLVLISMPCYFHCKFAILQVNCLQMFTFSWWIYLRWALVSV